MSAGRPASLRFLAGVSRNAIWLVPSLALAWPRFAAPDPLLWAYVALVVLATGIGAAVIDPVSIERREGGTDRLSEAVLGLSLLVGVIVAAADIGRWHLGDGVPTVVRAVALAAVGAGYALRIAAVWVNTFFSGVLLIQADRGHQVIDRGPYAVVRHPGNASLLLILPGAALALGSLVALAPMAIGVAAVLRRTALEDDFLARALEGYPAYAARVRFRLVPWVY